MLKLRQIEQQIMAKGKVDSPELNLESLRRQLYAGGQIDRPTADFLIEVHKRVQRLNPGFDQFFYTAIKDHVLRDGRIDAEKTAWLRQGLFAECKLHDEDRKFLHELKGDAAHLSQEFILFFEESMKKSPEQRTCG